MTPNRRTTTSSSPSRTTVLRACLQKAGLSSAVGPALEAAGFDTVAALADLQPQHFTALGIHAASDRRKLFLLVQSIQQQQKHSTPTRNTASARSSSNSPSHKMRQSPVMSIFQPSPKATTRTTTSTSTTDSLVSPSSTTMRAAASQPQTTATTVHSSTSHTLDGEELVGNDDEEAWSKDLSEIESDDNDDHHNENEKSLETSEEEAEAVPDLPYPPRRSNRLRNRPAEATWTAQKAPVKASTANDTAAAAKTASTTMTTIETKTTSVQASTTTTTAAASRRRRASRLLTPIKRSIATVGARLRNQPQTLTNPQPQLPSLSLSLEDDDYVMSPEKTSPSEKVGPSFPSSPERSPVQARTLETSMPPPPPLPSSFQAQIAALRLKNAQAHQLFVTEMANARSMNDANTTATSTSTHGEMRIRVVVRKRPMSTVESAMAGNVDILQPLDYEFHDENQVHPRSYGKMLVYQPKTRVDLTKQVETLSFCFDNVFDQVANNAQIYERAVQPLIPGLFEGKWATLFAYGQSGSGKTYTIMGSVHTTGASACNYGLYFLAAMDIFQMLRKYPEYQVGVSLFEIYGGKLFDLFNERQPVKCLEDAAGQIHFPGLSERDLSSPHVLMHWIHEGSSLRSTGTTSRNADSSRSHAVLQLHLRKKSDKSEHSRMTLIDLAGSERGADTRTACRTTRMEGAEINTSLLTLKEVIRALAQGSAISHVPFRGSKLTQVLKESFVGSSCRTVMIACVSPNIGNCEHTLNTLRYANRVKERNPETGETLTDAVIVPSSSSSSLVDVAESPAKSDDGDETENRVLDEILGSPNDTVSTASPSLASPLQPAGQIVNPMELANEVIRTHKKSMKDMLDLTSREMALALDSSMTTEDYLRDVEEIHQEQLGICSQLRQQIEAYRRARSMVPMAARLRLGSSDDDSVEDLRDF